MMHLLSNEVGQTWQPASDDGREGEYNPGHIGASGVCAPTCACKDLRGSYPFAICVGLAKVEHSTPLLWLVHGKKKVGCVVVVLFC